MVILSKKRLSLIFTCLIVSIFSASLIYTKSYKTVETVALPVSNKVVVLDARAWDS